MASQELKLGINGLVTSPNPFSQAPLGSFSEADNVVCKDADVLESRRGFGELGALSGGSRISSYQGAFIGLAGTTLNYSLDGATWTAASGTFSPPSSTVPMRFAQASQNFFFTTSNGVYKLGAYNELPYPAGIPQPPPVDSEFVTSVTGGTLPGDAFWLQDGWSVAYRVVVGLTDPNKNLIISPPSDRYVFLNASGSAVCPQLAVLKNNDLITASTTFIQIYRSLSVASGIVPSDELFLCYQGPLTFVTKGSFNFVDFPPVDGTVGLLSDSLPEAFLGADLYTNASEQGIAQANTQPPLAEDIANFKGNTLYANTLRPQSFSMYLSAFDTGAQGSQASYITFGDAISITNGTLTDTYTASATESVSSKTFKLYLNSSSDKNRLNTTRSLARVIYQNFNAGTQNIPMWAFADDVGNVVFQAPNPTSTGPKLVLSVVGVELDIPVTDMVSATGTTTVTQTNPWITYGNVTIAPKTTTDPNFPVLAEPVTVTGVFTGPNRWTFATPATWAATATSAQIYTATHTTANRAWTPAPNSLNNFSNSAEIAGISVSKIFQPEAVPLENDIIVGDQSQPILRIVPLRDSVLIFKAEGLYRLTGSTVDDFTVVPYDLTVRLACPDTAVAIQDNVLCYTDRGVLAISESGGATPISRQIDETLLATLALDSTSFSRSFAVPYESERQYILWVPSIGNAASGGLGFPYSFPLEFANGGSGPVFVAYVYSTVNNCWTRWPINAVHAIIDPTTNKLTALDGTIAYQEFKTYTTADYTDFPTTATVSTASSTTLVMSTNAGFQPGDWFVQGSNAGRVLAVALDGVTLTVESGTWTAGSINWKPAIPISVGWLPSAGQNPGTSKQFRELSLNFRLGQFNWVDMFWASDVTPSPSSTTVYGNSNTTNVNVRTLVPTEMARGTLLNIGFEHNQAFANFQLQSASLIYRPVSTRTPSQGNKG